VMIATDIDLSSSSGSTRVRLRELQGAIVHNTKSKVGELEDAVLVNKQVLLRAMMSLLDCIGA
jgi:hypothetical protein